MIDYSPTARRHVHELIAHCRGKRRPEAIRNLLAALTTVEVAIETGSGRPRQFPGHISEPGSARAPLSKEATCWIAYDQTAPPIIIAVFRESADIASRYPETP